MGARAMIAKPVVGALALLSSLGTLGISTRASACGGCFHGPPQPQSEASVVTGHRMAFAISEERTVLWDQIQYSGLAEDFSWVLPVRPGAYIETSRDSWFESLDAVTTTRVSAPVLLCATGDSSSGCGCSAGMASASSDNDSGFGLGGSVAPGVNVLHEGTVGPYDTVTLSSTDGDTLSTWLNGHGYQVEPDIVPVIRAYVDEGWDFIALQLSPGQGINQMTPVRVVTPGPPSPLPLRMVAAGVGASVAITLYVIGEGRFALPDLREVTLDLQQLSWDFSTAQSNYLDLRRDALAELLGYNYLTTFADRGAFSNQYTDADGVQLVYRPNGTAATAATPRTLADLYFEQSRVNDPAAPRSCASVTPMLARSELVEAEPASGAELPAEVFDCGEYDDIGAAMIGMHPVSVWLNRLDLDLPKAALSADCIVSPNASQQSVSHVLRATRAVNRPVNCPQPLFVTGSAAGTEREVLAWLFALGVASSSRLRRRGRRK